MLEITGHNLDLNDPGDGLLGGTLDYVLNGSTSGTFSFANANHNSIFNSSSSKGVNLELYVWGGDGQNSLGIVFGFFGTINTNPPGEVPLPGTLALPALGLAGLAGRRKARR